ncbi:hypothetical protein [Aquimarina mytili]|uniref:Macroglobulin domain-containing protein n=1 Tax=Aquimarina mytili TaxID=874423 RepID=A0A937DBB8_9FLAO|nr:hypothetical protein [Aquimarina mytili]MBL0684448.1 hypothetical protein [Aquimarina mytili]
MFNVKNGSVKINPLLYIFLFLFISNIHGQRESVLKTAEELSGYYQVPQEKMFIHYNTTLLFSGEYLYYKVYCLNTKNNLLSDISKIAYVELIDEDKNAIFKHKVKLENGVGQGDFFLPVSVPSGNYKLIGYTQWMINAKDNLFFQGDISILNPYQGNQKTILSDVPVDTEILPVENDTAVVKTEINTSKDNTDIKLNLDKQVFKKRSPVVLTINMANSLHRSGNYSISVNKKDFFTSATAVSATEFSVLHPKAVINKEKSISSSFFLPEMRGDLIYGKIIPKESTLPVSSIQIALSVPGKKNDIKIATTNNKGVFIFSLNKDYSTKEFVFQILGENRNNYTIVLNEIPEIEYPDFDFYTFEISESLKDHIVNRSVNNQIDNSFFVAKPDTIQEPKENISFYGKDFSTYDLDEYTRFATIKETVIEIVDDVWTKSNKKEEKTFAIRGYYPTQEDYEYKPLVIIDGIVEQDHKFLMEYDARKIKRISFVRDRYFLGTKIFEGVLIFETLKGDYLESLNRSYIFKSVLKRPLTKKKYYKQRYLEGDNSYNHIPDFRHQLFWEPSITLEKNNTVITFFTSDAIGDYEISIEGFTNEGVPVSLKRDFRVE